MILLRASLLLAGMALSQAGLASGAADELRAYMLASSCLNCHADGAPGGAGIPTLHGWNAEAIDDALTGFRDGSRPATIMQRLARGYSDEEITLIARWLAARD